MSPAITPDDLFVILTKKNTNHVLSRVLEKSLEQFLANEKRTVHTTLKQA